MLKLNHSVGNSGVGNNTADTNDLVQELRRQALSRVVAIEKRNAVTNHVAPAPLRPTTAPAALKAAVKKHTRT